MTSIPQAANIGPTTLTRCGCAQNFQMPVPLIDTLSNAGDAPADPALGSRLRELQVVMDHAGVGIAFIKQRTVVRCNQLFADIYGFADPSQVQGKSSQSLYPSEEAFRALGEAAYPVMAAGLAYKMEVRMQRANGQLFWTHLTGTLVDPAATEHGSVWIVDDIDKEKNEIGRAHV